MSGAIKSTGAVYTGWTAWLRRRFWSLVPLGGSLPESVWLARHRFLVGLTWFHAFVIAGIGLVADYSWEWSAKALFKDGTVLHTVFEGLVVGIFAFIGSRSALSRTLRASAISFGLISSSAILVHLSGGYIELHFHFFVMLVFLALYHDWSPYLLAVGYVAIHHGLVGTLWPHDVYNHAAAINAPWTWGGIHAFFIMFQCVGSIIAWRFSERAAAQNELILKSVGEGIYGLNHEGQIIFANPVAAEILCLQVETLIGRPIAEFVDRGLAKATGEAFDGHDILSVLDGGALRNEGRELVRREDGTQFPVEYVSSAIVERGERTGAVVSIRDITERERFEETLHEKNVALENANLTKDRFLANMSHELRTPLNGIIGFAELMHDGKVGPVSVQHKEYLADILASGRHLLLLINDMLDLSKVEAGKMELKLEPVDLESLVYEVRGSLHSLTATTRIQLQTDIDRSLTKIVTDRRSLKQVLYNFLSNAIKFTGEGGQVNLRVIPEDDKTFRLEVEDTGIGIAPEDIGKLFVEFQQLDNSAGKKYPGTGLGLALTKRLVENQGGHVGVRSIPGSGSLFYAILPRVAQTQNE
jgi:PAS domain S-box-containing protein